MKTLNTRPIKQRKQEPNLNVTFQWSTIGSQRWANTQIRTYYKRARMILNLSPYQARTYTFGRMVEVVIFSIRKAGEIEADLDSASE